jgi:hypothetical protein
VFGFAALFPLLLSVNRLQTCARALCVLCLAVAIEVGQSLLYRHRTEWRDFRADVLGIMAAVVLSRLVRMTRLLRWVGPSRLT